MIEEKIYTKTGDKGTTSLYDGKKIKKDDVRVDSYGTIDELISLLGVAKNYVDDEQLYDFIHSIQKKLFYVAAELATKDKNKIQTKISEYDIDFIEKKIDFYMNKTTPPEHFIIPGSNKSSAYLHLARTVCRRAERLISHLANKQKINEFLLIYVNRLSDLLYAIARVEESRIDKVVF